MENLLPTISNIIQDKFYVDMYEEIKPEHQLRNDLTLDSLDELELVMECEKVFDISIPDERIDDTSTVQDLMDIITELKTV